jgi:Ca-activated chloride channel homolog
MFENVYAFFILLFLPILVLFLVFDILKFRKRAKMIAGNKINNIIPYYSEGQKWLKIVFYTLGFILAVFALARPRWGYETINTNVKGRDILVVLDVSFSMATNDLIPSRLEAAKREINELLGMETGDRIGLLVFSGESELLSPVTNDYAAVSFFLDSVSPNMLPKEGTDIGGALTSGIKAFDDNEPRNKMILLFTDGEDLQGDYYAMLKNIKDSEIKVFTIGVGTKEGDLIPVYNSKGEKESALKDSSGNFVKSKLDEKRLIEIAETTGGSYLRTTGDKNEIINFFNSIKSVELKNQGSLKYEQKKERYDIFLIPALIFLIIGFILDQGRLIKLNMNKFDWLFNKNLIVVFILLAISANIRLFPAGDPSGDAKSLQETKQIIGDPNGGYWGNKSFIKGDYKNALEKYLSAQDLMKGNDKGKLYYNIGNTYYKVNDLERSSKYFEESVIYLTDDKIKSMAYFNEGLVIFKKQNYGMAKDLFKKSILLNPEDEDARYNYMVCKILEDKSKNNQQDQNNQTQNKQQQKQEKKVNDEKQKQNDNQKLSNEDIDKLLKALDEKEKKENKDNSNQNQDNTERGKYW